MNRAEDMMHDSTQDLVASIKNTIRDIENANRRCVD